MRPAWRSSPITREYKLVRPFADLFGGATMTRHDDAKAPGLQTYICHLYHLFFRDPPRSTPTKSQQIAGPKL